MSTFNNGVDNNINIFNKVEGFENINVATDVTLFESAEVTGADSITIQKDGNLILRIDSTNGKLSRSFWKYQSYFIKREENAFTCS